MADLGNYGSLGNWFASLLLLTASLLAIVIYSVRRHKVDDYRGHYHVWLWAAACWFIMATDVAASLHQGLQQVMISLTGTRIAGDGSIWWVVPALLFVGAIGSRLLVDMWSSRLSSAALILAAIAYLTALVAFFHGIHLAIRSCPIAAGAGSSACWTLAVGHVDGACTPAMSCSMPRGLCPSGLAKKKAEKKAAKKAAEKKTGKADQTPYRTMWRRKIPRQAARSAAADADGEEEVTYDEESGDTWVAVDPPHGGSQPVLKRVTPAATSAVPATGAEDRHPRGREFFFRLRC